MSKNALGVSRGREPSGVVGGLIGGGAFDALDSRWRYSHVVLVPCTLPEQPAGPHWHDGGVKNATTVSSPSETSRTWKSAMRDAGRDKTQQEPLSFCLERWPHRVRVLGFFSC
ncbi:hypothetical protein CDEST_11111 [Colletotrichum destructivum]|uniref:Uncharacterized protein n=1 Tax=Colletotrichum destructivum TaxID=34406 RepID=A0AAX4IS90_9PEZI|nr:hypothetical protein CDEST_11111 [Colletotrichum destructivum]